jgi:cytochrome c551/c552
MKKIFPVLIIFFLPCIYETTQGQTSEGLFNSACATCHTINKGRLVGPDLTGIYDVRETQWLIDFIRSSQQMIKSGDSLAVAIYEEYNRIPMPDNDLSDEEILSLIDYIKAVDQGESIAEIPADSLQVAEEGISEDALSLQYTSETVPEGRSLYYGYLPFENKGSPCISCHHISEQSLLGGGKLSTDLTHSFSKLGPAGLNAILTNPPFPVMRAAMQDHPLTPEETHALISLLKSVDEMNKTYEVRHSGGMLFFTIAFISALFLLVHIYVFYDNRKIRSL